MVRIKILPVIIWFFASPLIAQDEDETRLSQLEQDVLTILDAGQGQVRKWIEPPTLVVIYRDDTIIDRVFATLKIIEDGSHSFVGFGKVSFLDLDSLGDDIFGEINIRVMRISEEGPARNLVLTSKVKDQKIQIQGNILIFALEIDELLLMGALTKMDPDHMRGIARGGEAGCYYSVWSRDDVIRFGGTYVRSDYSSESIDNCLYKEIIQSLGLLNDAADSDYFTLDDQKAGTSKRPNDFILLDALYSESVSPGAPVMQVLDIFQSMNRTDLE